VLPNKTLGKCVWKKLPYGEKVAMRPKISGNERSKGEDCILGGGVLPQGRRRGRGGGGGSVTRRIFIGRRNQKGVEGVGGGRD
jgi:hypothetical protein